MKSPNKFIPIAVLLALGLALSGPLPVSAEERNGPIAACLKAWGDHPFGKNPQFKTLGPSVKVFGMGTSIGDTERTNSPVLVLVEPIVNVMGESTIELSNPNGWYCLRTTVSVIGSVNIRANCKAQLAETSDGNAVPANSSGNRALKDLNVTVVGSVSIERPCT